MISIGSSLPLAALHSSSFSVIFIQVLWFTFSIILPLSFLVVITTLWWLPASIKTQELLMALAEFLMAWASLDVALVRQTFVEFIESNYYDRFFPAANMLIAK